jgi:hypothetical protein
MRTRHTVVGEQIPEGINAVLAVARAKGHPQTIRGVCFGASGRKPRQRRRKHEALAWH